MQWRLYYDDGSFLEGDAQTPVARRVGVVGVAQRDPDHNWTFWHGRDWYILQEDGEWLATDLPGMLDQVTHRSERIRYVLPGRTVVPYRRFASLLNRMLEDCRPAKTGWHPGE